MTNCEECSAEIDADLVLECECGVDGICPDCYAFSHDACHAPDDGGVP